MRIGWGVEQGSVKQENSRDETNLPARTALEFSGEFEFEQNHLRHRLACPRLPHKFIDRNISHSHQIGDRGTVTVAAVIDGQDLFALWVRYCGLTVHPWVEAARRSRLRSAPTSRLHELAGCNRANAGRAANPG